MNTNRSHFVLKTIICVAVMVCAADAQTSARGKTIIVDGSVIAYEEGSQVLLTSVENVTKFFIRIDNKLSGKESARFVRIEYRYWYKDSLPSQMYDGKSTWRFTLERSKSCDKSIKEIRSDAERRQERANKRTDLPMNRAIVVPTLQIITNLDTEGLSEEKILPCYQLKTQGFERTSQ